MGTPVLLPQFAANQGGTGPAVWVGGGPGSAKKGAGGAGLALPWPWLGAWPARCTNRVPSAFPTPIPRSRVPRPPVAHLTSQERRREGKGVRERGATCALEQRAGVVVSPYPYLARAYGIPALRTMPMRVLGMLAPLRILRALHRSAAARSCVSFRFVSQQLAPPLLRTYARARSPWPPPSPAILRIPNYSVRLARGTPRCPRSGV